MEGLSDCEELVRLSNRKNTDHWRWVWWM